MKLLSTLLLTCMVLFVSCYAAALPRGNYQQTCRGCYMRDAKLFCKCKTKEQIWNRTHLKHVHNCGYIKNINGNLRCTDRPVPHHKHHHALPAGNYKQTCRHCSFDGRRLACQCLDRKQHPTHSVLYNAANCRTIKNYNGSLICKN